MTWDQATNGPQLLLTIDPDELNEIKAKEHLFTEPSDTYISFDSAMVFDMSLRQNQVEGRLSSNGLRVANGGFEDDSIRPVLDSFELDMASEPGILTLSFSETVDVSKLNMSLITLQNKFDAILSGAVSLTNLGNVNTVDDSTVISITLHQTDFNQLKLKRIGLSDATTWLVLGDGFVEDMAGGLSVALNNGVSAKQVKALRDDGANGLTLDTVDPRIEVVDLNMNDGTVDVIFSEPVDLSKLNPAKLRIQGKRKDN
jgi:hypothetical protein